MKGTAVQLELIKPTRETILTEKWVRFQLPASTVAWIEEHARECGVSKPEVLVNLVSVGIQYVEGK